MTGPDPIPALTADGEELDRLLAGLDDAQWKLDTPAPGWTIAHQVAHLAATFRLAGFAAADPDGFRARVATMSGDFDRNVDMALSAYLSDPPHVLLNRWREERATAEKALAAVPDGQAVPWLVRTLPAPVLACAGMMELFGHGQDIADTLGVRQVRTDRIRFLCGFAVRTWDFGYQARGESTPEVEFGYTLTAPSGAVWRFGPEDAEQRISGPAEDFCLLVTRRRHRDDLALTATGADAQHWLDIAQAYRGPAGAGRRPGQFGRS
ncbi:TIGR03084 family metal-binding protein [Micromonospora profundi]|uniref:TIGR03084 family metal-binding protein n=1 Tax=Micromonospora profundi TaxID=1420889 RepID=A0AAJ6HRQ1_9ACTN|nr:TIGR03084 family metal-binding protein [Micromonospora profundi]WLS43390.1 TIGR03084 family metal-binding protein [Micromonospora profundi]